MARFNTIMKYTSWGIFFYTLMLIGNALSMRNTLMNKPKSEYSKFIE